MTVYIITALAFIYGFVVWLLFVCAIREQKREHIERAKRWRLKK